MKREILIVDDDPDIGQVLKQRLEFAGTYHCTCVRNAEGALLLVAKLKPALVILDLGMPHLDGTVVLKNMKDWLENSKMPPIIILSGHNEKEVVDYCMENGAKGFIAKPPDLGILTSMVNEYLAIY